MTSQEGLLYLYQLKRFYKQLTQTSGNYIFLENSPLVSYL